jgi:hypothetical protein
MIERTTVRLPGELLDRARRRAAEEGRTLTALIEDGLRLVVSSRPRKNPKSRERIPVSKASGGMSGIDLTDIALAQEMEDLEYVERMKHYR